MHWTPYKWKSFHINEEWNTGISIPVKNVVFDANCIFPKQEYDWGFIKDKASMYVNKALANFTDSCYTENKTIRKDESYGEV